MKTTLTIIAPGVLANDSDIDTNTITAILVAGPAHGTLSLNANGSFTYTPVADFNGADSFTYRRTTVRRVHWLQLWQSPFAP
jgi:hypothetical protein